MNKKEEKKEQALFYRYYSSLIYTGIFEKNCLAPQRAAYMILYNGSDAVGDVRQTYFCQYAGTWFKPAQICRPEQCCCC